MTLVPASSEPLERGNLRSSGYARNADDFYCEPPWATEALLEVERFDGAIWDPACGRGTIPIVANRVGYKSIGTDRVDRGFGAQLDFLTCRVAPAPNIICNPPFDVIQRWIAHAMLLCGTAGKIAIFARLAMLEGVERGRWFQLTPLARVWVFSGRVSCPPGESAPPIAAWQRNTVTGGFVAYAWFVWDAGHRSAPTIGFLPRINRLNDLLYGQRPREVLS